MTLNEYIAHLQAFRDANPGAGKLPVVSGDELDSPYYSELDGELTAVEIDKCQEILARLIGTHA